MKRERIEGSPENIVKLSDIRQDKLRASSPYGPLKVGLITWQRTSEEARLMELLNSLESVVQDLNYKSFTVYDTLNTAIETIRAALSDTTDSETGTSESML
jgi:hypothetical protein